MQSLHESENVYTNGQNDMNIGISWFATTHFSTVKRLVWTIYKYDLVFGSFHLAFYRYEQNCKLHSCMSAWGRHSQQSQLFVKTSFSEIAYLKRISGTLQGIITLWMLSTFLRKSCRWSFPYDILVMTNSKSKICLSIVILQYFKPKCYLKWWSLISEAQCAIYLTVCIIPTTLHLHSSPGPSQNVQLG